MIWIVASSIVAVILTVVWPAPRWLVPRIARCSPGCLYPVPTRARAVALTLDDGPDRLHTPEILRLLRDNGARATFFLISGHVPGLEDVVSAIVGDGNELGNHLTRDEPSIRLSAVSLSALHELRER